MAMKTVEKCFMNLNNKQSPNPNFRKEWSGYVVLQQQKLPGSTIQQASRQEYFYIFP
jgi:hypothetical protein